MFTNVVQYKKDLSAVHDEAGLTEISSTDFQLPILRLLKVLMIDCL